MMEMLHVDERTFKRMANALQERRKDYGVLEKKADLPRNTAAVRLAEVTLRSWSNVQCSTLDKVEYIIALLQRFKYYEAKASKRRETAKNAARRAMTVVDERPENRFIAVYPSAVPAVLVHMFRYRGTGGPPGGDKHGPSIQVELGQFGK
jgi:hypothetical protein